jgi:hypothetical protein
MLKSFACFIAFAAIITVGIVNYAKDSKSYYLVHKNNLADITSILDKRHDACAQYFSCSTPLYSQPKYQTCVDPDHGTAHSILRQKRIAELRLTNLKGRVGKILTS